MGFKDINMPVLSGLMEYTQAGSVLTGTGDNGKFKATVSGTYQTLTVNDTEYSVKNGEDNEIELTAGTWYFFILDRGDNTINFKRGGGLSNTQLAIATAEENDVISGKTFYSKNKELKDGKLYYGVISLPNSVNGSYTTNGTCVSSINVEGTVLMAGVVDAEPYHFFSIDGSTDIGVTDRVKVSFSGGTITVTNSYTSTKYAMNATLRNITVGYISLLD